MTIRWLLGAHYTLSQVLVQLSEQIEVPLTSARGRILIARDTRDSGPEIVAAVMAGANALDCKVHSYSLSSDTIN